ncbi:SpaN/EivJ family type III secretion system needle length determinant [Escherichia albertii]|uniref:SpaN/EivJ family type III secretion system needle length determinant n=1 Tax=Escherichia albertii TaxID=208962 RepID=UPI000743BD22|nr:type III secretion system needle length determinant, SpaN/EivJ family [Escherichia albertii]
MDGIKQIAVSDIKSPEHSGTDLEDYLKKKNKNKEQSESIAGTLLQLLKQTHDIKSSVSEKQGKNQLPGEATKIALSGKEHVFPAQERGIKNATKDKVVSLKIEDISNHTEKVNNTVNYLIKKNANKSVVKADKSEVNETRNKKMQHRETINVPQHSAINHYDKVDIANIFNSEQHIEKSKDLLSKNINSLLHNASFINNTNAENSSGSDLIYQFQRWGKNHSVQILESSEGLRLKPSDSLVTDRLYDAQNRDEMSQRWVMTEHDERERQQHSQREELQNEEEFGYEQKDES